MEGIKIIRRPKLRDPYFIVAWPGMGEVAFKAATHLVEKLKMEEFARILPEDFFYLTGSVIEGGILGLPPLAEGKFYYWKKQRATSKGAGARPRDLIVFISNAQPDLTRAQSYSEKIIDLAKSFGAKEVIGFASMPSPIDHTQEPTTWFAATSEGLKNSLKKHGFNLLSQGQISGMNGLFLGIAKKKGMEGFCLLGEIPLYTIQIENPKAAKAVLAALTRIMDIRLDFSALIEQAQGMETEINRLLDYLKLGPTQGTAGPIGEEEIEKIKKSLSQLTKLPFSVKEKIDKLFLQAENNIATATELKSELDKWNVYKEYEDKFLDLFRKNKDKGN
ncbi:MAG: PAC2 family protein [Candidatus Omnitrophica bacterium]|nr:PAC2 family protein [Candidatus Omnitrophota bacterium]